MNAAQWIMQNGPGFAALTRAERSAVRDFALLWSVYEGRHIDGDEANFATIQGSCLRAIGPEAVGSGPFRPQLTYFQRRYGGDGSQARLDALMNNRTPTTRNYVLKVLDGSYGQRYQLPLE